MASQHIRGSTQTVSEQPSAASTTLDRIELWAELAAVVALRAGMGDPVVLEGEPAPLMVRGDRLALRRALANLIDNGLRHGTRVVLRARSFPDGIAQILVTDNGLGVPADMLDRLGQPFDRLDPSRDRTSGGAGLGLAIVRALMDRQGGGVQFRNGAQGGLEAMLILRAA